MSEGGRRLSGMDGFDVEAIQGAMVRRALPLLALLPIAAVAPGPAPVHLSIPGVSTDKFESHPAYDPWNGDLYFVRSSPNFKGWKILRRDCGRTGAAAEPFRFAGPGVEADPFFTADGGRLYFISSLPDPPAKTANDLDIWYAERDRRGVWASPVRLPAPVNSAGQEWFPRVGRDGALTFGSDRPGGFGATDIYSARQMRGRWEVRNLGGEVSTGADDYEFEPSRDGRFAILMSDGQLFRIGRKGSGWGRREALLPGAEGLHVGPLLSPSGRTLLFAHGARAGPGRSGELFRLDLGVRPEAWPPPCGGATAD